MHDSVNTSAKAISRGCLLSILGVNHLERLVVKEEVWGLLLAILHGHIVVLVPALAIARDGNDLRAKTPFLAIFLLLDSAKNQEVEGGLIDR